MQECRFAAPTGEDARRSTGPELRAEFCRAGARLDSRGRLSLHKKSWTAGGGCPTQKSHPARGPDGKNGKGQILVGGGVGCGFWSRLLGADAHAVERAIDERD